MEQDKKHPILFICFLLLLFYPLGGKVLDSYFPLAGVVAEAEKPILSLQNICDGTYQTNMENYLSEKLNGRNLLVKLHNQLLYSIFRVSSNKNVVIGAEGQLFEPEYLHYSLNIWQQPSDEQVLELVDQLVQLKQLLQKRNKQLYIFITPSKGRYYKNQAPVAYKLCEDTQREELAYDKFIRYLEQTDLKVFDSIKYIDDHRENFDFPLWYPTGIHWSRALGSEVAAGFNRYLKESSGYDLGQIRVKQIADGGLLDPDADLYKTLNLLKKPKETFYTQEFIVEEGMDKPNVFFRGGSFMGQSLRHLIDQHIFTKSLYLENRYYVDNNGFDGTLSDFDCYDELDISTYLEQSDMLVLEVNENKIWIMSWGFIDYLLDYYES